MEKPINISEIEGISYEDQKDELIRSINSYIRENKPRLKNFGLIQINNTSNLYNNYDDELLKDVSNEFHKNGFAVFFTYESIPEYNGGMPPTLTISRYTDDVYKETYSVDIKNLKGEFISKFELLHDKIDKDIGHNDQQYLKENKDKLVYIKETNQLLDANDENPNIIGKPLYRAYNVTDKGFELEHIGYFKKDRKRGKWVGRLFNQ